MVAAVVSDVREVLAGYPGLADVAVLPHEQQPAGQVLVAYVVPSGPGLNLAELYKHLRGRLAGSSVPAAVVVVEEIPRTAAGEPDPQGLAAPDLRVLAPYRAPQNDRQQALCEIFADVLARPRCGIDDNFFTLGGESIDAMLIASRASVAIGQEVSMDDLFDTPTVAELDEFLDQTP